MTATPSLPGEMSEEIASLIGVLHRTGLRLEELTGGEVDAVADQQGRAFLLLRAQETSRQAEVSRQAAILNALPAYVALLDSRGIIISVNDAWSGFAEAGAVQDPGHAIGSNYLEICDRALGDGASASRETAQGIRSVLSGERARVSVDYSYHSQSVQRCFVMTVTALAGDPPGGAVLMHLDVTAERQTEDRLRRLNRVHAVLSGINSAIVRISQRDELFREACRIAVEVGAFKTAWIGAIDSRTLEGAVLAWFGGVESYVADVRLTARDDTPESEWPASRALRLLQPVICNDIRTDPSAAALRHALLSRGLRAAGFFPLPLAGKPSAVIALFAAEVGFFDGEETQLLLELAGNISFALDHLENAKKLHYVAYYDVLTGLANRRLFLERVAQFIRIATGAGHKLALCLLDLERFKSINDTFGQAAGDGLLIQMTDWLTQNLGDASLCARVGSDQFAVVLPEVMHEDVVARLLDKTMKIFLEHPFQLNDSQFRVAAKVGVALFPDDGAEADALFRNAELALKKAKASGDRYLFYAQKMTQTVAGRLVLDYQLRHALDNEEFVLHYQPKVDLLTGRLAGAEALIRWNDPKTGLVPPGRFIPILEETGLIFEVGRWALRKAIEQHLRWCADGFSNVRIAVNVSPLQLRNRGFIAEITAAIGVDARAAAGLALEITESVIMADIKHSIATLRQIRAMGVSIAVDDFGTGFSSLSYLAKLPVDTLKIDRSFVADMKAGPDGVALVSMIISLARSLKLTVVAEGVETNEQTGLLRALKCDEMQGFLLGKAVPSDVFETRYLNRPERGEFIAPCVARHRTPAAR